MALHSPQPGPRDPAVEAYLLGTIDIESGLALQQRLVYEAGGRQDGQISLLLCEHPDTITMGRAASRAHLRLSERELTSRRIDVHWTNRGGGAVLHAPGQLAIYPIVPLERHGWSVGEYLARLQQGLLVEIADFGLRGESRSRQGVPRHGIWLRSGQVAFVGAAVKNWTTYHGAFLNVAPSLQLFRYLDCDPWEKTPAGSLSLERKGHVSMAGVRASVVRRVAEAFGCPRYHIYTGHPLFTSASKPAAAVTRSVS
jgi:lipoyl(octanoyl) transferase